MKTKLEIIEETCNFYNLGNRAATESGYCEYLNDKGQMCAFGRCCKEPGNMIKGSIDCICAEGDLSPDEFLKEEYHWHNVNFWQDIQNLHDLEDNWTDEGLSERGEENKKFLISRYK